MGGRFCPRRSPSGHRGRARTEGSTQTAHGLEGQGQAWGLQTPGDQEARRRRSCSHMERTSSQRGSVGIAAPTSTPKRGPVRPRPPCRSLHAHPSPASAPSLSPCFPGQLAGGPRSCSWFWRGSDVLREAEMTQPESRPTARAPRQSEGCSRYRGGGWLPPSPSRKWGPAPPSSGCLVYLNTYHSASCDP